MLTQKIKPQYLLHVKIIFRYVFQPQLILNFLCLLALIIHELRLGDKGKLESTKVKKFQPECNVIVFFDL